MTTQLILADKQDITKAGVMYISSQISGQDFVCRSVEDKTELIELLKQKPNTIVVLDYTLFDINDIDELEILAERFPRVQWVLFSVELSLDFVRRAVAVSPCFSVLLKESSMHEIRECLQYASRGQRYICQRVTEILLLAQSQSERYNVELTPTEQEIVREIAHGLTTKEIAKKRALSIHTINTHRKNIFSKLNVNTAHDAIKYAIRAGIVNPSEFYI